MEMRCETHQHAKILSVRRFGSHLENIPSDPPGGRHQSGFLEVVSMWRALSEAFLPFSCRPLTSEPPYEQLGQVFALFAQADLLPR